MYVQGSVSPMRSPFSEGGRVDGRKVYHVQLTGPRDIFSVVIKGGFDTFHNSISTRHPQNVTGRGPAWGVLGALVGPL
jgi:hypothetical protein